MISLALQKDPFRNRECAVAGKPGGMYVKNDAGWQSHLQNWQAECKMKTRDACLKSRKKLSLKVLKDETFAFCLWSLLTCHEKCISI